MAACKKPERAEAVFLWRNKSQKKKSFSYLSLTDLIQIIPKLPMKLFLSKKKKSNGSNSTKETALYMISDRWRLF
jgi:hypothetical protein